MTAFVRTPSKLPDSLRKKVTIVQGDVLKREQVEDAIQGHDFVLSALGSGWGLSKCADASKTTVVVDQPSITSNLCYVYHKL